jgi:hypothetical protein
MSAETGGCLHRLDTERWKYFFDDLAIFADVFRKQSRSVNRWL